MARSRPQPAAKRAGIYARISVDRLGDELGVRRQVADCSKLAKARGLAVVDQYVDNDLSAFKGARRPEYERLLGDVRDGRIDVVLAWHPDRLYRHPRDLEAFVETVESAGAAVATVQAGELDLSTPSGRMVARMLGATARYELEHKAERQRRKHLELAEAGKPTGGGDRPFGYDEDRVTVREDEAVLIREAVERICNGGSLRGVATEWAARGVRTPRGGSWSKTSLSRMLTSARIAGLRSHRGVVIGPAVWPGIITPERHAAIVAILKDAARRRQSAPRSYLLTGGLARCGRCGAAMVARPNGRHARRYACTVDAGGCNRTFHIASTLEDYVAEAALIALDGPVLAAMRRDATEDDDAGLTTEIAALEARRREAVDAYSAGALSLASFQAADREVESRLESVRDQLAARSKARLAISLPSTSDALRQWWDVADLESRRELVRLVVDRVEVGPAVQGRNRFDPSRVSIRWRV